MYTNQTICEGCLSVNRTLTVTKCDITIIVQEIFEDADLKNTQDHSHALWLCWECDAVIRRFMKLKQQMRHAQEKLAKYMLLHTNITSLSHLGVAHRSVINIPSEETKDDTVSNDVLSTVFVKIEDMPVLERDVSDYDYNDSNNDFDSHLHYDNKVCNDMDNGHDLKVVPEDNKDSVKLLTENIKVRKKTRNRTKARFNDSDDEPLKLNNEDVEPGSKRKKEKGAARKDRRKSEKPAGVVTNSRVAKKLEQLNVSGDQLEMVLLSWEEVETERQAAMSQPSFTRHQSRCHDCVLGFNHPAKLDEHMRKHQPIQDGAQCTVCRVWCKDARSLSAHRRRHRLRWRCRTCGEAWSRAANAADHTARAHGAPPPTHTCALCGHQAQTLGKLRYHVKSHAERQKCELCGKTFRDRTSLRTHLFIHKGEKNYACPKCDKRFLFKSAMEIHLETHNASAQLYCHQCDMNFKNRMSYNQHMRYNLKHIDPAKLKYACDACDKKFAKATRLQEHKMAVHLKLTPIACTLPGCHFSCSSRPVLRTHIRMQHRDGRDKRNHVCHLCGKAYASKNSLEGHLRAHSGERPLRCASCPASFGYDAALYNHVKHVHLKHKKIRSRCAQTAEWTLTIPTTTDET